MGAGMIGLLGTGGVQGQIIAERAAVCAQIGGGAAGGFDFIELGPGRSVEHLSCWIELQAHTGEWHIGADVTRTQARDGIDGEDFIGIGIRAHEAVVGAVIGQSTVA